MGDFLVGLLPGHVSASFSSVRVPAADGIRDSDVTDPDGSGTAVSEGEVGLVAVNGAVDGGLLGDYKVSISGHPYALVPQGIMGVSPSVPGATPKQVVGQPGVEDFEFLGAVASAGGWEWKAEAEGQGNGEVWSFEAEGWEDGDGLKPVPCSISSQGKEALGISGVGVGSRRVPSSRSAGAPGLVGASPFHTSPARYASGWGW
ncbi:hypothetical protein CLOM_g576 [Closterium sp. NIES-68]|nr:hypothetical protein CLOM_g576 [Closterium sp. NIES-68]